MVDLTEFGISQENTQLAINKLAKIEPAHIFEHFDERVAKFICSLKLLTDDSAQSEERQ